MTGVALRGASIGIPSGSRPLPAAISPSASTSFAAVAITAHTPQGKK